MEFELQPRLENELVRIQPLQENDFELLYTIASDPLLWQQHPNKDRYKREVFTTFFKGAIESKGAFLVSDVKTREAIGSSRFYDVNEEAKSVFIGYTFIARSHWGKGYNPALKSLMLQHAFKFAERVLFHVGAVNVRSQKAMEKLGAIKAGQQTVEYYGEQPRLNFIFYLDK
jgi:RimJ/RimL family protein N-acetyltransferase